MRGALDVSLWGLEDFWKIYIVRFSVLLIAWSVKIASFKNGISIKGTIYFIKHIFPCAFLRTTCYDNKANESLVTSAWKNILLDSNVITLARSIFVWKLRCISLYVRHWGLQFNTADIMNPTDDKPKGGKTIMIGMLLFHPVVLRMARFRENLGELIFN